MRVTTVRLRPLRRKMIEEAGIDTTNIEGQGAELWVGGHFCAVLSMTGTEVCEIVWGTEWANRFEDDIRGMALYAYGLMANAPEGSGVEA